MLIVHTKAKKAFVNWRYTAVYTFKRTYVNVALIVLSTDDANNFGGT